MAQELTQERLKDLLHYDPETGIFNWLSRMSSKTPAGAIAGTLNSRGYVTITLNGKKLLAHRLAWLYMYGYLPPLKLDHKNRVRTDNRLANLRLATNQQNSLNQTVRRDNTSGIRGVSFDRSRGKWRAHVGLNGKHVNLGRFESSHAASEARRAAEVRFEISNFCQEES